MGKPARPDRYGRVAAWAALLAVALQVAVAMPLHARHRFALLLAAPVDHAAHAHGHDGAAGGEAHGPASDPSNDGAQPLPCHFCRVAGTAAPLPGAPEAVRRARPATRPRRRAAPPVAADLRRAAKPPPARAPPTAFA